VSVFKTADVSHSLTRKGFVVVNSHHVYFRLMNKGSQTDAVTYMSHGSKSIDQYLQARMAKQLGLTAREFQDLVRCPLTQEKLVEILAERGRL